MSRPSGVGENPPPTRPLPPRKGPATEQRWAGWALWRPQRGRARGSHPLGGGGVAAEAPGVETLLEGARRRSNNDDELFRETEKTFDLLYEAYFDPAGKG